MISKLNLFKTGCVAWLAALLLLLSSLCVAQQLTGTLIGTALDSSGAAVPNAKVTMTNQLSGDVRTTLTNGTGYFTITAIRPGTYNVVVSAQGFKQWQQTGLVFNQGDSRNLPNITLQIGTISETVEITADQLGVTTDNGEISTTLNTTLVTDIPIVGRDAGELIKLMPGAAATNGLSQGNGFDGKKVGTNSGPVGNYSINGTQPNGAMAFMLDGANLVDPGNMGTQIANINEDMVQEVKFLTSSYSAEYAKGPVIFQAFSKSGGSKYHGEGYLYTRNSALNSWDAYSSAQFTQYRASHSAAENNAYAKTLHGDENYNYLGGNFGGPVPFMNSGRHKLFFWAGYEYMRQHPSGTPINYNVPTQQQLGLDTAASQTFCPTDPNGCAVFNPAAVPSGATSQWGFAYGSPYNPPPGSYQTDTAGSRTCGGASPQLPCSVWVIPSASIDPSICGVASGPCSGTTGGLRNLYPTPNITPNAGNGWNNYTYVDMSPQNRWELTGKLDYAIGDNTKITFSYTKQNETDYHPIAIWWSPPWTLPYPGGVTAAVRANVYMANFTHVFSPTTTNEFVFTYARFINPNKPGGDKWKRSSYNFTAPGLFGHTSEQMPNIISDNGWGGSMPDIANFSFDGSFNGGGAFGGLKRVPALYDNFTKVIGSHTLKFGAYWDMSRNTESNSGNYDHGIYNFGWGSTSSGNIVMDYLVGAAAVYQQASAIPMHDLKFHHWAVYGQDQFKATRRMTLNYGLRLDHVGQWYGMKDGMQVWDQASYTNDPTVANPGLLYHSINSRIPLSGYKSPLFYYEPRVGIAYDLFGNGKTVLRGGFGVFRYQISTEVCGNQVCDGPLGTVNYSTPSGLTRYDGTPGSLTGYNAVPALQNVPSGSIENGGQIGVLKQGDDRTPYTMGWNVSLSRALPWRSVFEMSYIGNKTKNIFVNGTNGNLFNLNNVPAGGFFQPLNGVYYTPNTPACASNNTNPSLLCSNDPAAYNPSVGFNANIFRPMSNYTNVYLMTHEGYANYNSLQMGWRKQSGPVTFLVNYTWSKVLGTRDWNSDNGASDGLALDPFNLRNDYGVLAFDHTHIVNASYVWNLPKVFRSHPGVSRVVDGWQLSGFTTYSSGANIQANMGNLNVTYPTLTVPTVNYPSAPDYSVVLPNGLHSVGVNQQSWLGSNAYWGLIPALSCDPRHHASGLYFNPDCFTTPPYGQQGNINWPYLRGPAYFNSDLALFKNFQITENQRLQFRISAVNFLNHALPQFGLAGNADQQLNFDLHTTQTLKNATTGNFDTVDIHALAPTNQNANLTGKPKFERGSRTLTFAVKYFF